MLGLRDPKVVTTGFDRPNLYFGVVRPRDKDAWLLEFIRGQAEKSGIVYCATRKNVETVCRSLQSQGFSATRYHAGLPDQERQENQEDFVYDRVRVMVATNAFGMGIDKSNVSYVVHYNMPKNLESYYQEAGRAGRDGGPAECILLYGPKDVQTAKFLILNAPENEELPQADRARVERMYPYGLGVTQVIHMLRGSRSQRVLNLRLDTLPTYGILREVPREQVQAYVDCLVEQAYLLVTKTEFPVVHLTEKARQVLFQGERVLASFPAPAQQAPPVPTEQAEEPVGPLVGELKALRTRLAQAEHVPAYIICTNAALTDMAAKLPTTMEELLEVSGVGAVKAARYGEAFLDVIRGYLEI
jgi:ATP-dependent DNA helicase RecQ